MFAHIHPALHGICALFLSTLPTLADDVMSRLTSATEQPAFVGTNLKQETVTATCSKFIADGSWWSCYGYGTATAGTKAWLVTNINCRAYAFGTAVRSTQIDVRHGTSTTNWTDTLTFGLSNTLVYSGMTFQAANQPVEYVVQSGHKAFVEASMIGTGITSAKLTCTFTGRLTAP
jgi:hypothetical protein